MALGGRRIHSSGILVMEGMKLTVIRKRLHLRFQGNMIEVDWTNLALVFTVVA